MAGEDKATRIPCHVAIIMDGNGRWATRRGLPRVLGHRAGMEAVREVIRAASDAGVKVLSLFAFSTENWARPEHEIDALMSLLVEYLESEVPQLDAENVRLEFMGDMERLEPHVLKAIEKAISSTRQNTGLRVNIALSYGGRWDILEAAKQVARMFKAGLITMEEVTEEVFAGKLASSHLPDPDLIIRASGELRISNFYLWQAAYAEIWSTPVYWPDFRREHFEEALREFGRRERRYGRLGGEGVSEKNA